MTQKLAALAGLLALVMASPLEAATLVVPAARDATLIEAADGLLANGSGPHLFTGRTSQASGSVRRGMLWFDVAAALPRKAQIVSVRLELYVSQANPGTSELALHDLGADWTEGPSFATGGGGAPAALGDVTWLHRSLLPEPPAPAGSPSSPVSRWVEQGGDFDPGPTAVAAAPGTGLVVLEGPELVDVVRDWLRHPARNHGWILLGDESQGSTARRIDSRENVLPDRRPRLVVDYLP